MATVSISKPLVLNIGDPKIDGYIDSSTVDQYVYVKATMKNSINPALIQTTAFVPKDVVEYKDFPSQKPYSFELLSQVLPETAQLFGFPFASAGKVGKNIIELGVIEAGKVYYDFDIPISNIGVSTKICVVNKVTNILSGTDNINTLLTTPGYTLIDNSNGYSRLRVSVIKQTSTTKSTLDPYIDGFVESVDKIEVDPLYTDGKICIIFDIETYSSSNIALDYYTDGSKDNIEIYRYEDTAASNAVADIIPAGKTIFKLTMRPNGKSLPDSNELYSIIGGSFLSPSQTQNPSSIPSFFTSEHQYYVDIATQTVYLSSPYITDVSITYCTNGERMLASSEFDFAEEAGIKNYKAITLRDTGKVNGKFYKYDIKYDIGIPISSDNFFVENNLSTIRLTEKTADNLMYSNGQYYIKTIKVHYQTKISVADQLKNVADYISPLLYNLRIVTE